jgi:molybdopterin molybdotransferase
MISFEKAQQIVLDHTGILDPVRIPIAESQGMVLAEDIVSGEDIPCADIARIGGFAIRSMDALKSDQRSPVSLVLDGAIKAGCCWKKVVESGHAVMVEAGTPLPEGADTIISNDFAVRENSKCVKIYKREKPGEHIFIRGGEIENGELIFSKNRILSPADIGTLATIGLTEVSCYRKPKVSFFVCGDDLILPDQPIDIGKIRSANIFSIEAHLREYNTVVDNMGIINCDPSSIQGCVENASDSDMLIVSTGSSPTVFDKVKMILQKIGLDLKFWRVAIRPGKPLIFGTFGSIPVLGLSENQLSTTIVMEEFVRPAVMKMMGRREIKRTEVVARLDREIKGGGGKTHFIGAEVRLTEDGFLAIPENNRPARDIRALMCANGIIVVPPEINCIEAGEMVRIQVIGDPTELN